MIFKTLTTLSYKYVAPTLIVIEQLSDQVTALPLCFKTMKGSGKRKTPQSFWAGDGVPDQHRKEMAMGTPVQWLEPGLTLLDVI